MKRIILATSFAAALLASVTAHAQSADANSDSASNSQSASQAVSQNNFSAGDSIYPANQRIRNTPGIGLAATTNSFSSDYCGGTVQAGGSAPGISLGFSKATFDANCQSLRRAEKFGQLAISAHNLGNPAWADKLLMLSIFEVCNLDKDTRDVCVQQNLVVEPSAR